MEEKLCECGCGLAAVPGKKYARYHQVALNGRVQRWTGEKYEYYYRLVAAEMLGRPLLPGEVVHHKNGNMRDDRPENLEVCASNASHISTRHNHIYETFVCEVCGTSHKGELRSKHHFCSRACWAVGAQAVLQERFDLLGRTERKDFTCAVCGTPFIGRRHGKSSFCSQRCYWDSLKGAPSPRKGIPAKR